MEIKVFGTGCARCDDLVKMVQDVVAARGCNSTVSKITDLKEIMAAGVFSTPGVMVDGVLKCSGRVPTQTEVAEWLDGVDGGPTCSGGAGACCCNK